MELFTCRLIEHFVKYLRQQQAENTIIIMPFIVSFAVTAASSQHSRVEGGEINKPMDKINFSFLLNVAFFPVTGPRGITDVHL